MAEQRSVERIDPGTDDTPGKSATINGRLVPLPDDPDSLLIDVLREDLGLTGTKLVCGAGVCGACTVLLDGAPVVSCLLPAAAAADRSVTTVEGVGTPKLHAVQKSFMAHDALQCGFCTPGFVVEAVAFHDKWRAERGTAVPSREEIGEAFSGHLCRCSAYDNIFRAVAAACSGRFDGDNVIAPRVEARDKVIGAARYTVDVAHTGQLEGVILRARVAHARIDTLDLSAALAIPGVAAAIPLLPDDMTVRYVGQQIAAVAAVDRGTALAALRAIEPVYSELPAVVGLDAARAADAATPFAKARKSLGNASEGPLAPTSWKGNVRGPSSAFSHRAKQARRWLAAARDTGDPRLVEATFTTGTQQHTALEPHAAVARFERGELTVHVSTQWVFEIRKLVAKRFKLDPAKVRIIAEHVGGGFGAKGTLGIETIAAVALAKAAGAPVRVVFDRHAELSVSGYRPGAELRMALLPGADGSLQALSLVAHADTGASVNSTIAGLARLIYPAQAKDLVDYDVVSNLPPGAPFRGPGGPPMAFALEQGIDEAALRLGVDPIDLRRRWDPNPNRQRLYDWASSLDIWRRRAPTSSGRFRRGVGVAAGFWLYLWQPRSKVELAVEGGRLVAKCATQDIGTGTRSVLAGMVAREFGLEPEEIVVRIGDSRLPEGPGSGGSRVTASIVPPTLLALGKLKAEITRRSPGDPPAGANAPWRERIAACPDLSVMAERPEDSSRLGPGIRSPLKDAGLMGNIFAFLMRRTSNIAVGAGVPSSVQIVEVEVDTWLGRTRVCEVHTGIAVGKIASRPLAQSQASGAVIQGIGYALYEDREVDPHTGDILTAGLEDYRIPGIADTPVIEVHFDEGGFDHVLGGSVGIGEVATVPTGAAIANAVRHALGVRPTQIPLRPDRLLDLMRTEAAV